MRARGWLLIVVFSVAGVGLMLWRHQANHGSLASIGESLRSAGQAALPQPSATTLPPPAAGTMHKCVSPGRALYTDGPCPPGTQPAEVRGGSVTVVTPAPAAKVAASASGASGAKGNIRELLVGSDAELQAMRDRRMDQVINPP